MVSKKLKRVLIAIPIVILVGFSTLAIIWGVPLSFADPSLEFPMKELDNIEGLSSYGIDGWSGPGTHHNGIDIVINESVTLISPVKGTIVEISEHSNPHSVIQNILFSVSIKVNWKWTVSFAIEPNFPGNDTVNNTLQRESIVVKLNQRVKVGDNIATLLYSGYYSHLHYSLYNIFSDTCAYNYSSDAAKLIFDTISEFDGDPPCVPVL